MLSFFVCSVFVTATAITCPKLQGSNDAYMSQAVTLTAGQTNPVQFNFSVNAPLTPCSYVVASSTFTASLVSYAAVNVGQGPIVYAGPATVVGGTICNGWLALSFTAPANVPLGTYQIRINMTSGVCSNQVLGDTAQDVSGTFTTDTMPVQVYPARGNLVASGNWTLLLPAPSGGSAIQFFGNLLCDMRSLTSIPFGSLTLSSISTMVGNVPIPFPGYIFQLFNKVFDPTYCASMLNLIGGGGRVLSGGTADALSTSAAARDASDTVRLARALSSSPAVTAFASVQSPSDSTARQLAAVIGAASFSAAVTSADITALGAAAAAGQTPSAWLQSTINSISTVPSSSLPLTASVLNGQNGKPTLAAVQATMLVGGSLTVYPPASAAITSDSSDSAPLIIGIFVAMGALLIAGAAAAFTFSDPRAASVRGKQF